MRYVYDLYFCNFGNLCAFKLYRDGELLEHGDLIQLRVSGDRCEIYTYETIVFLFLEQIMQNIEKRYWSHIPDSRKACKVNLHTMIDEPFFINHLYAPTTKSEVFLKQYIDNKMFGFVGGFDDKIIKPMANGLKREYDRQKATGTLAVFKHSKNNTSSDEWSDIYQTYK